MLVNPDLQYFMAMTGNDQARIFSAGLVAGRLIAAWRLRVPVSGVLCGIADHIMIYGFRLPLATETIAPIRVLTAEANAVMEICALQAATTIATRKPITTDGANREITEAFEVVDDILGRFGRDRLKLLVRALLMPPYTKAGIQPVPRMADIEARDRAIRALAAYC